MSKYNSLGMDKIGHGVARYKSASSTVTLPERDREDLFNSVRPQDEGPPRQRRAGARRWAAAGEEAMRSNSGRRRPTPTQTTHTITT
eukprot:scaffold1805_cov69-Cyclotella_meneghiniana.AAC.1